ncbi:MAG: hypothetical protein ACJ0QV_05800 [Gammaproteobacteria bacterium]
MMNNNYKIFGLIVSLMRNDNPPEISKDFSENVMQKISTNKKSLDTNYNNLLKIAASVFFAVITAYSLISFERSETNVVSVDIIEDTNDNTELIKRVKDDSSCVKTEKNIEKINDNCK